MLEGVAMYRLDGHPSHQAIAPEELRHVGACGPRENRVGSVVLRDLRLHLHQADAISDHHRLVDVMRHEHDSLAQRALDADELVLQALARDAVDSAEGLVHQEDGRVRAESARETDALTLASGKLMRITLAVLAWREAHQLQQLVDARPDLRRIPLPQPGHR